MVIERESFAPVIAIRKATGKREYRTLTPSLFAGHAPCSSL
jgi:hypothetical protein